MKYHLNENHRSLGCLMYFVSKKELWYSKEVEDVIHHFLMLFWTCLCISKIHFKESHLKEGMNYYRNYKDFVLHNVFCYRDSNFIFKRGCIMWFTVLVVCWAYSFLKQRNIFQRELGLCFLKINHGLSPHWGPKTLLGCPRSIC